MQVRIKTGFFEIFICDMQISADSIEFIAENEIIYRLENGNIRDAYLQVSELSRPVFEFGAGENAIQGEICDFSDTDELILLLKKIFGKRSVII